MTCSHVRAVVRGVLGSVRRLQHRLAHVALRQLAHPSHDRCARHLVFDRQYPRHPRFGRQGRHDQCEKVSERRPAIVGKGRQKSDSDPFCGTGRLNWGGSQAADHLLKLMQLKYPAFPGRLSSFQSGVSWSSGLLLTLLNTKVRFFLRHKADPPRRR